MGEAVPAAVVDRSTEQHERVPPDVLPPAESDVALLVAACIGLVAVVVACAAAALS